MSLLRLSWVTVIVVLLGSCAGAAPRGASGVAAARAEINAAALRWERAVARWDAEGSADAAAEMRDAASVLRAASLRCAELSGCLSGDVLARYGELFERQAQLLASTAVATGEPGDGAAQALAAEENSPILADLPAADKTITLLKGRELADVIAINGPVKAALNEWLTWMRPQLIDAYENYQHLRHLMWPEYEQAGLPEALLFGILAKESGGKVHAVSRAGASGPLQFMPATGYRLGLGRSADGFDTRFDPRASARANVRYLNERFAEFNNDLALALGAYNGGEGRMLRLYRHARNKSFWDASLNAQLPPETRDYVPMVLAAAWLFLHPEDYGLEFPQVAAAPAVDLVLQQPASINQLTICLGQEGSRSGWFRALRNLNPRYESQVEIAAGTTLQVPPRLRDAYAKNCVNGARAQLAAELAHAAKRNPIAPLRLAAGNGYTVRRGDTIAAIARRHQCSSPHALAVANGIKGPRYMIKPGQTLRLSGCRA